VININLE